MRKDVLDFIKQFESAQKLLLEGRCYWFAVILKERFDGQLMYNQIMNHWACLIDNQLYDASGAVVNTCYEEWPGSIIDDTTYYNRLVKQCIEYTE